MKKVFMIIFALLAVLTAKLNAQTTIGVIDYGIATKILCINGYTFVKINKSPMLTQYFEVSKSGRSIPLTCKKYIENKNKILKAKTVLVKF